MENLSSIEDNYSSSENENSYYTSSDDDFENRPFDCPKCGYEYTNFNESDYKGCIECGNNYCKNCGYDCENCKIEICFRCSTYLECCQKNGCTSCNWYCDFCQKYHCNDCDIKNNCVSCEYDFCKDNISSDHKINLCNECCDEYCYFCSELTYENPCENCIEEIEDLIDYFKLPLEINKYIISYL